jgi:hypothetical protein
VLTIAQIEAAGLSPRAVRDRAAGGRLRRAHSGIYAVDRLDDRGRWMAAVLACGPNAVLSHRSAAALWGFCDAGARVDVSAPTRAGRSRTGIDVHRAGTLGPGEVTVRERIPCTSAARTLLDLAAVLDRRPLERALDRAEELGVFDLDALHELLRRHPRRRGRRVLASVLADYDGPTTTRSDSEELMLALVTRAGLPRPRVNAWIALDRNRGYEADFLWPDFRLIVEVDGALTTPGAAPSPMTGAATADSRSPATRRTATPRASSGGNRRRWSGSSATSSPAALGRSRRGSRRSRPSVVSRPHTGPLPAILPPASTQRGRGSGATPRVG